jgi:hypothetical protein
VLTITGITTNSGSIRTSPELTNVDAIIFDGSYEGLSNGKVLTHNDPSKTPIIVFNGDAIFNADGIDLYDDVIRFESASAKQLFNPGNNLFAGKIIINNAIDDGVVITGSKGVHNGELVLSNGTLSIESSSAWLMDTTNTKLPETNGFSGISGTLTLGDATNNNVSLVGDQFTTASGFVLSAVSAGTNTITSLGDVIIDDNTNLTNLSAVDFVIQGTAPSAFTINANVSSLFQIDSLSIESGSVILSAPLSAKTDIEIKAGSLDVSTSNHNITLGRHWIQDNGAIFDHQEGSVLFTAANTDQDMNEMPAIFIYGSTKWFNFIIDTPLAKTVKFARNEDATTKDINHVVVNNFIVKTSDATKRTILTKMDNADYTDIGRVHPNPNAPSGEQVPLPEGDKPGDNRYYFWNITVDPVAEFRKVQMDNVTVYYSWAEPDSILVIGPRFATVDATPYREDPTADPVYFYAHYSIGWTKGTEFLYSFTEDINHNGRIDRIRVQTSAVYAGDFSDFEITVDDYVVTGYGNSLYNNMFFIFLEEKPYADGGNTPSWRLNRNNSLVDDETGEQPFIPITDVMIPIDTTWPVVHYSLMLPKTAGQQQQMFVQFSEPVKGLSTINTEKGSASLVSSLPSSKDADDPAYFSEYLVDFANTIEFTISDMTQEKTYEIINPENIVDYKNFPNHEITFDIGYPFPRYPDNQYYNVYTTTNDDNNYDPKPSPLFKNILLNYPHTNDFNFRMTDMLISIPPINDNDKRYFALPIFARDEIGFREPFKPASEIDLVAIRKFDGSATLRDMEITLEAQVNPSFSLNPDIIFGASVPSSFRGTIPHTSDQLWLPYDSGLVPDGFGFGSAATRRHLTKRYPTQTTLSNNRVEYVIGKDEEDYRDDDVVDFYFTLPGAGNLAAGRLDMSPEVSNKPWYQRIKPFSFNVKELVLQRGGATILNNVINPTKGEKTYLDYTLTKSGQVTVQVFTLDGNLVQVLFRGSRSPGDYMESWDGKNRGGRVVARGMYFIRIVGPDIDEIRKVMVVK